ncbi:MAG: glycosyltransferase family 2 protein [Deltaproteobacteria bacterium]|nr:glycosyltransferase family 2 protein [Deltaproteobacteria bacterium]MBI3390806.1 glycosyltransferase family 2 protein [Deltaproteobacteria bacterium]
MTTIPAVGVVIVSWNGGEGTDRCIESMRAQRVVDYRIVLVDNDSEAVERARLRQRYGNVADVELIELPANRGYAGGNNAGIERALQLGARFVLVLTQDVVLRADALAHLLAAAQRHPNAGVLGPVVIDAQSGAEQSRGERIVLPLLCAPRTLLRYRRVRSEPYAVSGLLGCVVLLTRRCLEEVGAFDPAYFAYYEEVDLCLRAGRAGYEILCVPTAVAAHDGMRGFAGGFTPLSAELKSRNLLYLMRKHGGLVDWVGFWPLYSALIASSMIWYALRGRGDIVRALGRGLRGGWRGRTGAPTPAPQTL